MRKNLLKRYFGKRIKKKYQNLVNQINSFEDNLKILSQNELKIKTFKLQKQYKENQNLNPLIAESFALTREASSRTLGLRHFDVQLIGGLVLNSQKIAEMKTGEGKTLVATLPACLNALTGKGVHIITVNNYLVSRDQVSMGQIYRFLGFNTGLIQDKMSTVERQKNYKADITYLTNSRLVFNFLEDNLVMDFEQIVLRPFNYCLIDEVDSILIDEARTPLIIGSNVETPVDKYLIVSEIMNYLKPDIHYKVDEKNNNIILTEYGNIQVEKILQIQTLYNPLDPWIPYVINAIKASALYFKNSQYIIQKNRIIIIDEFTGRIMPDRKWSDGLHQAIEAKENLPISQKSATKASITYQSFFQFYSKISGMTGTGKTSEIEFEKIYNLSVEEIPTARPNLRQDLPDFIYKDKLTKWNAVAETCNTLSATGQPVLIGTTTIENSEMLAELLTIEKLPYQLLNAKPENVRRESEIVAQAGKKNAITIATNMAGRGTDIILGGNINFQVQKELYNILTFSRNAILYKKTNIFQSSLKNQLNGNSQKFLSVLFALLTNKNFLKLSDIDILRILQKNDNASFLGNSYKYSIQFLIDKLKLYYKKHHKQENKIIINLGGLYILGTERNDSRRVDNQLRGRCGRQGDPGTSRFFLSLDDKLLRLFGGPKVDRLLESPWLKFEADSPLENRFLSRSLNSAQRQVEEIAYQQRKDLFDFDASLDRQREHVYFERKQILKDTFNKITLLTTSEQAIIDLFSELKQSKLSNELTGTLLFIESLILERLSLQSIQNPKLELLSKRLNLPDLQAYLIDQVSLLYHEKKKIINSRDKTAFKNFECEIILTSIDKVWSDHLEQMTLLREAVRWRGYGQQNPLAQYRREAAKLFNSRHEKIRSLVICKLLVASI